MSRIQSGRAVFQRPEISAALYILNYRFNPDSSIHILNVLHLIQQDQLRGAEVFAAQLVRALDDSNSSHHALVALRKDSEGTGSVSSIVRIRCLVKRSSGALGVINEIRSLRRYIADERPDVLVAHGAGTLKLAVLATLWGARPRIVYRNIGVASWWAGDWKRKYFNRFLLKRISAVVSVSEFTAKDFVNHYGYPGERVSLIPNGVEGKKFADIEVKSARAELRLELGVETGAMLVVSVGSLSPEKGPADLVKTISGLRSAGVDAHLVLVGSGRLKSELEAMARDDGVNDRVHFLGARDDVPTILRGSDIFALTSRSEGMPAVIIEAGMAGLPTVAYDVGAVAEVVQDGTTGFVVDNADLEDFRFQIAKLIASPDLRRVLGDNAQLLCQQRFDMDPVANQYREFLIDLVGKGPFSSYSAVTPVR